MSVPKKWLSAEEVADYIGVKVSTIYSYINRRIIPHHKPPGSSLVKFKIDEIDEWINDGKVETVEEHLKGVHRGQSSSKTG